jgi:hypothetical protein
MMNKVSDIPQELMSKIRQSFEVEPRIRELRVQQQMMMRTGKYDVALALAQQIDVLFNRVVYEYLENARNEVEKVEIATMNISLSDKENLMRHLLVCFMCADIIESSVIDMDDILHRYDKNTYMEMFNDIRQVMSMAKEKLRYMQQHGGYMKDLVWGEKCDNMYEMMLSKAGSIMRKMKSDPNWGKNMEKFNEKK